MDPATTIFWVLLAVMLEAFFSGSEIGMVSVNRIKMKQMEEEGNSAARSVLTLLDDPEKLFTTTSLGTNLAMMTSTAIFTAFMVSQFGDFGEWMAMVIILRVMKETTALTAEDIQILIDSDVLIPMEMVFLMKTQVH